MRRASVIAVLLALVVAGCGSSSSSATTNASRADSIMSTSCFTYADVALSAANNPKIAPLTQQQGLDDITTAATNARAAATLDPKWSAGAESFATLAGAMRSGNDAVIAASLHKLDSLCSPFIARELTTTTTSTTTAP